MITNNYWSLCMSASSPPNISIIIILPQQKKSISCERYVWKKWLHCVSWPPSNQKYHFPALLSTKTNLSAHSDVIQQRWRHISWKHNSSEFEHVIKRPPMNLTNFINFSEIHSLSDVRTPLNINCGCLFYAIWQIPIRLLSIDTMLYQVLGSV